MKPGEHDPRRLDIATFATQGGELEGRWPLADLPRLAEDAPVTDDAPSLSDVSWSAHAERRPVKGGEPELWLHLEASADVPRECQRCLAPVALPVAIDRWLRFVPDEALAAELDADSEDDVLALPRWLDLHELVEDELLLALPLVPRHAVCPAPLPMAAQPSADEIPDQEKANPFAALAQLKRRPDQG